MLDKNENSSNFRYLQTWVKDKSNQMGQGLVAKQANFVIHVS